MSLLLGANLSRAAMNGPGTRTRRIALDAPTDTDWVSKIARTRWFVQRGGAMIYIAVVGEVASVQEGSEPYLDQLFRHGRRSQDAGFGDDA
jgi:hypothetical protein